MENRINDKLENLQKDVQNIERKEEILKLQKDLLLKKIVILKERKDESS